MKAEQILELVDQYGMRSTQETYDPVREAIVEVSAERRQLAKHCLPVIRNGDGTQVMWCTVCQSKMTITEMATQRFQHRDGCLVAKVEGEG